MKNIIVALAFIIFVIASLLTIVKEQFQVVYDTNNYEKLESRIVEARNTNKRNLVRRGELKNLQDGDEIEAIRALDKLGGEKLDPIGFNGINKFSPDISMYSTNTNVQDNKTNSALNLNTPNYTRNSNFVGYNKNINYTPVPYPTIVI